MSLKLYQQYLILVEEERKMNQKYLQEIETGVGVKLAHGARMVINPLAAITVPYMAIRAMTSKCYRKCFGSHLSWTSALCQNVCKVEEARKKIGVLNRTLSSCKDSECKSSIKDKIEVENSKIKILSQKIAEKKAHGGSTGITRDDQE